MKSFIALKSAYLVVTLLLFFTPLLGQVTFNQHPIGNINGPTYLKIEDMNNDDTQDVVVAGLYADSIVWFEAPNWIRHTIVGNWDYSYYIDVKDMDKDQDLDVVATSYTLDRVAWFDNPDWTPNVIDDNLDGAGGVCMVDMDGDDTLDVVVAASDDNSIGWYEAPNWDKRIIDSSVVNLPLHPDNVFVRDIDGDQDLDILVTSWHTTSWTIGFLIFYNNNGNGWDKTVVDSSSGWIGNIDFANLDDDDTLEVVATLPGYDKVVWYDPPSWTRTNIDANLNVAIGVGVGDLNKDDTLDVVAAGQLTTNPLRWYEGPDWDMHPIYQPPEYFHQLAIADLDNDTDLDVIASIHGADEVAWFENLLPSGPILVPEDYPSIQAGIDAAMDGDTVLVADSTYYENINFKGKAITIASYFLMDGDTSHISSTIIDGSQPSHPDSGSVVTFRSGEDTTSVLMGFTITGGTGKRYIDPWGYPFRQGGGVDIISSGAKIVCNKIIENHLPNVFSYPEGGAGICVLDIMGNHIIISDNEIVNNSITASQFAGGGGISLATSGTIHFTGNLVEGNSNANVSSSLAFGGGMYVWGGDFLGIPLNGTIIISGNIVKNNSVTPGTGTFLPQGGGGFYIDLCSPEMTNNIIIDNNAPKGGGVLVCGIDRGGLTGVVKPNLINNTISGNYASEFGGGIYSTYSISDTATIINTILWEDSAFSTGNEIYIADNPIDVAYSDIDPAEVFGNWNSINNINADPLFIAGDSLYHLTNSSPCVNTGADSIQIGGQWYYCPPYDYEGDERPYLGHQADMGADETQVPTVGIEPQPDAGLPQSYVLEKNYPNPFNPTTNIEFSIPKSEFVTLKVYNILGEEVTTLVSEKLPAGRYKYEWDASRLASGIYLYRIQAGDPWTSSGQVFVEAKKMVLLR